MVGKIELQACPRDYHQSVESYKKLHKMHDDRYFELEKLYVGAGFSGMENFGGNQTVAHSLQYKNFVYEAKKSFKALNFPAADKFMIHGLIRESSINGYSPNDDDIAEMYFKKVKSMGNSVRIFSGANDFEATKRQINLAKENGLHVQVDISIQNIDYNIDKLKEFVCRAVDYGADQINFKSHSGNSNLKALKELTEWMDETLPKKIKLGFHTHCTYGNAYKEIQTFVDSIKSDRGAIIHTGMGRGMSDGFAQPDPNKIIEMFPDKVVYNKEGLEKLNAATEALNNELKGIGLGNKDLREVLKDAYKHKYSDNELDQHVEKVFELFMNANIPGGGALYTVNDIKGAGCIGERAKGRFELRDYLVDYLKTAIEFHKFDGSPDDVTPFYFNREQSTKFFLNTFYNSQKFDSSIDISEIVKPENIKFDKNGKILQSQILGVYGRMPNSADESLIKRALVERMDEAATSLGHKLTQEETEKYLAVGKEVNKLYLANKRRQNIVENTDKLFENYGSHELGDEKAYYNIRSEHLQERLEKHVDSHDITMRDGSYKDFMLKGNLDDLTKKRLKNTLSPDTHDIIESDEPLVKALRKAATPQVCTPSLLLDGQIEKAKERIDAAVENYIKKKDAISVKLPAVLLSSIKDPKHKYSNSIILVAQFLRPTIDASEVIPRVIMNSYNSFEYKKFQNLEKNGEPAHFFDRSSIGHNTMPNTNLLDAISRITTTKYFDVTNPQRG